MITLFNKNKSITTIYEKESEKDDHKKFLKINKDIVLESLEPYLFDTKISVELTPEFGEEIFIFGVYDNPEYLLKENLCKYFVDPLRKDINGDLKIELINISNEPLTIKAGTTIAKILLVTKSVNKIYRGNTESILYNDSNIIVLSDKYYPEKVNVSLYNNSEDYININMDLKRHQ